MMNQLSRAVARSGLLKGDLDYHFIRASMVIIFLLFGYQKWFEYEAQVLIPFISNGPLISWMYPVFGVRGASIFLGVTEWAICLPLFLGIWNRTAGVLGALGSCATFVATVTIIPFMPNGWDEVAGGFPAMTNNAPFLVKDVALLAASFYLLKQDVVRTGGARTTNHLIRPIATTMAALGLLRDNLEYHVLRAAIAYIFAAFSYTKWHQYGAQLMIPFISHSPFYFLAVSGFRNTWRCALPGCVRVDHLRAAICRILGQEDRSPWRSRFDHHLLYDAYDHPVHPGWLGSGGRVSGDGRAGAGPDEGLGPACDVVLLAETGSHTAGPAQHG
jgi:uncharacterized membrane protein YkgB